jgi:hypothetical protein
MPRPIAPAPTIPIRTGRALAGAPAQRSVDDDHRVASAASMPPVAGSNGGHDWSFSEITRNLGGPVDPQRRVVVADPLARVRGVRGGHLVGDLRGVLERKEALAEALGHVEHAVLAGAQLDALPVHVGRRLGPQVDDDVEDGAARDAEELGLRDRRALEVEAPQGSALVVEDHVGLHDAAREPAAGEFVLAPCARVEAAVVLVALEVDDVRARPGRAR